VLTVQPESKKAICCAEPPRHCQDSDDRDRGRRVTVEPTYRGFGIEVEVVSATDGYWKCPVRILRLFSREKPRRESVTCQTITAEHVERTAIAVAKRWIDDNGTRKQARGLRGVFIRDVNAADRTDFARHRVLHTTLMEPVARNAPAGRTPVGEVAPALTATTDIFSADPVSETSERGVKDGWDREWHPGNLSPR